MNRSDREEKGQRKGGTKKVKGYRQKDIGPQSTAVTGASTSSEANLSTPRSRLSEDIQAGLGVYWPSRYLVGVQL